MLLFVIILFFIYYYYNNMNEKKILLKENKNEKDDNNNNDLNEYTNLQCLRIPLNSYKTVFLYYKKYPKPSIKYPKDFILF